MAHRLESGAFGYELLWNPKTVHGYDRAYDGGGRFLAGLTDPATLLDTSYDTELVGAEPMLVGPWSGPGRGVVGPRSDPESDEGQGADLLDWAVGDG